MRTTILTFGLLAAMTLAAAGGDSETPADDDDIPSAGMLLADVVARLPQDPIDLTGQMTVRRRRGIVVRQMNFAMALNWGAVPPSATYTIFDAGGQPLERLAVSRPSGETVRYAYACGPELTNAPMPELSVPIQDGDVTWLDLTLGFLWWADGRVTGTEDIRGRSCFVVDLPAPAGAGEGYDSVRIWVDREMRMLLQAEARAAGEVVRRMWVHSFKKIDDRWMIKDLEVQRYPDVHRTKLHIDDLEVRADR